MPLNQGQLITHIRSYLIAEQNTQLATYFQQGYCVGLSSLWLFCYFLQYECQDLPMGATLLQYQESVQWFWQVYRRIIEQQYVGITEFIEIIYQFQHIKDIRSSVNQMDLHKLFTTNTGAELCNLELVTTVAYASDQQFAEAWNNILATSSGSLIHISSIGHTAVVYRRPGCLYYYDPNYNNGEMLCKDVNDLINGIKHSWYNLRVPLVWVVRVFKKIDQQMAQSTNNIQYLTNANFEDFDRTMHQHTLYVACQYGDIQTVTNILQYSNIHPDEYRYDSFSCLFVAAQNNYPEIVEKLLAYGANPLLANSNNITSLWIAIAYNCKAVVKILLEHPDAAQIIDHSTKLSEKTLLQCVAIFGDQEMFELLLAHNLFLSKDDHALLYAIQNNNQVIAEYLLTRLLYNFSPEYLWYLSEQPIPNPTLCALLEHALQRQNMMPPELQIIPPSPPRLRRNPYITSPVVVR